MVTEIQNKGYDVTFIALEIGSRGFISKENLNRLKSFISFFDNKPITPKEARDTLSKIAVTSSFAIYCAKNEATWGNHGLLEA